MSSSRRFSVFDLLKFNTVNLDPLTETYNLTFYLNYLARWPDLCVATTNTSGRVSGYILGKAEGRGEDWHGHVTAVTVSPQYRRIGLARKLMEYLEIVSEKTYDGYFVDLFVRASNDVAINMYQRLGYSVYRRVIGYYSGEEDALDMRKALPRDVEGKSVIPLDHPVLPEDTIFH